MAHTTSNHSSSRKQVVFLL